MDETQVMSGEDKGKRARNRVKIRKVHAMSMDQMAAAIAADVTAAIYSSVGNRTVVHLDQGDQLDAVVDQYLDKHGMSEDLLRLSSTRIEVNMGCDVSGSMYWSGRRSTIVPAMTTFRLLNKAFEIVAQNLPSNVFRYNVWLWSSESLCVTDPEYGSYRTRYGSRYTDIAEEVKQAIQIAGGIDGYLKSVVQNAPWWCGGGTELAGMVSEVMRWNEENGDIAAHKLDLVVTDGLLGDAEEVSKLQSMRGGRLESVLMNVSFSDLGRIPDKFTGYRVVVSELETVLRTLLLDFVQRIF